MKIVNIDPRKVTIDGEHYLITGYYHDTAMGRAAAQRCIDKLSTELAVADTSMYRSYRGHNVVYCHVHRSSLKLLQKMNSDYRSHYTS